MSYLRLRQICLVAHDLEATVGDLCAVFGLEVCHRDLNVGKYGLTNALMPAGTSFIEVVSPLRPGTAAGRYLERRRGDGGYMVINDCDDVGRYRDRANTLGIRIIEDRTYPGRADLLQLHPRDTGGCILEFDHHVGGDDLGGKYQWAGDNWQAHVRRDRVTDIIGAELQSEDPLALAKRWSAVTHRPVATGDLGVPTLHLDNARLRFVRPCDDRGEGLAGVELKVRDRSAIMSAAAVRLRRAVEPAPCVTLCGTRFYLSTS